MGIKVLGCTVLLSIFTVGSVMNNVSGALGNNQTVANVAENFDSKTNADNKKQDCSNENHEQKDNSKDLVFGGNNESGSGTVNHNLIFGGVSTAFLAGGITLGLKQISKGKEGEKAVAVSEITPGESNRGEEENEQNHNASVDETTTSEKTTDEKLKNENTSNPPTSLKDKELENENTNNSSNKVEGIFMFLLSISFFFVFCTGCCCCCCCCGNPMIL